MKDIGEKPRNFLVRGDLLIVGYQVRKGLGGEACVCVCVWCVYLLLSLLASRLAGLSQGTKEIAVFRRNSGDGSLALLSTTPTPVRASAYCAVCVNVCVHVLCRV